MKYSIYPVGYVIPLPLTPKTKYRIYEKDKN